MVAKRYTETDLGPPNLRARYMRPALQTTRSLRHGRADSMRDPGRALTDRGSEHTMSL